VVEKAIAAPSNHLKSWDEMAWIINDTISQCLVRAPGRIQALIDSVAALNSLLKILFHLLLSA